MCWFERLQEFDFEILQCRGQKHGNADAMSCIPCVQCDHESHEEDSTVAIVSQVAPLEKTDQELRTCQFEDCTVGYVLRAREARKKPFTDDLKGKSIAVKCLCQLWERLEVVDGVLWRKFENEVRKVSWKQFIILESLKNDVLQELHARVFGDHLGQEKTTKQVKKQFYWPGYAQDVRHWCQTCATCAARKTAAPKN